MTGIVSPCLCEAGQRALYRQIAQGERLRAAMPSARWCAIADAGRLVQEDQTEALARVLIDFLGEGQSGGS
jgi:pimeloyl-ACP methyl ester carboxylesterase